MTTTFTPDYLARIRLVCHHIHAVVNAMAHIHIEAPWLTKERFVAGGAAAGAVASGVALGLRLGFH